MLLHSCACVLMCLCDMHQCSYTLINVCLCAQRLWGHKNIAYMYAYFSVCLPVCLLVGIIHPCILRWIFGCLFAIENRNSHKQLLCVSEPSGPLVKFPEVLSGCLCRSGLALCHHVGKFRKFWLQITILSQLLNI